MVSIEMEITNYEGFVAFALSRELGNFKAFLSRAVQFFNIGSRT